MDVNSSLPYFIPGRRKGHNNNAMWMAGTVAAVSVSALAAISGKALMTSLLALMLTGAKMMHKGGGGGGYGCKSAALIDARTMEIDRIAAAAETEFNQHIPIHVFTPSAHGQLTSYSGPPKHIYSKSTAKKLVLIIEPNVHNRLGEAFLGNHHHFSYLSKFFDRSFRTFFTFFPQYFSASLSKYPESFIVFF